MTPNGNGGKLSRGVTVGQLIVTLIGVLAPVLGYFLLDRLGLERRLTQMEERLSVVSTSRTELRQLYDRRIEAIEKDLESLSKEKR